MRRSLGSIEGRLLDLVFSLRERLMEYGAKVQFVLIVHERVETETVKNFLCNAGITNFG